MFQCVQAALLRKDLDQSIRCEIEKCKKEVPLRDASVWTFLRGKQRRYHFFCCHRHAIACMNPRVLHHA